MVISNEGRKIGKEIKLVVCDLDGTLLNERHEISNDDLAAIEQARKQGIFVTVCSGRIVSMLEHYIKTIGICGPLIAANGGHIIDTVSRKTLWEKTLKGEEVIPLLDYCRRAGMDYGVLAREGCFFSDNSIRVQRLYRYNQIARAKGEREIPIGFFSNDHNCVRDLKIDKILIQQLQPGQFEQARQYVTTHTEFGYTSSEHGLLEVSAPGISKGKGVRRLAQMMKIPLEQTCAFGNYDNDISMFSVVGLAIAMANSSPGAKARAAVITKSNQESGVGWGLRHYIL